MVWCGMGMAIMIRTAHLGDLELVQLLADPAIALDLLGVELPLRQEPDLYPSAVLCPLADKIYSK